VEANGLAVRIVVDRPPNYDAIVRAFGTLPPGVIFAYGDAVYSPSGEELPPDLVAHEQVHLRQQAAVGGPEPWWSRYLAEPTFRLEQELEAYRVQIAFHTDRPSRRACLRRVARDLARPMYGRIVTAEQARRLLSQPA
jgi:hypothetical protein